jgi:acyl-CoA thioesterase I
MKLLCLGDSLTEGTASADWIAVLRRRCEAEGLRDLKLINAGIGGHMACSILRRLPKLIAGRVGEETTEC